MIEWLACKIGSDPTHYIIKISQPNDSRTFLSSPPCIRRKASVCYQQASIERCCSQNPSQITNWTGFDLGLACMLNLHGKQESKCRVAFRPCNYVHASIRSICDAYSLHSQSHCRQSIRYEEFELFGAE